MRRMHSAHHAISSHRLIAPRLMAPPNGFARQYGCKRSSLLLLLLHGKVAASTNSSMGSPQVSSTPTHALPLGRQQLHHDVMLECCICCFQAHSW